MSDPVLVTVIESAPLTVSIEQPSQVTAVVTLRQVTTIVQTVPLTVAVGLPDPLVTVITAPEPTGE